MCEVLKLRKNSRVFEEQKDESDGTVRSWQGLGEFSRRSVWQDSQGQSSQGILGHVKDGGFYPKCNAKPNNWIYTKVI